MSCCSVFDPVIALWRYKKMTSKKRTNGSGTPGVGLLEEYENVKIDVTKEDPVPGYICRNGCIHDREHHTPGVNKARKKLFHAAIFCLIFMIVELVGGWLANSLAVMADAAHLLSDLGGFIISIFAIWLTSKKSPAYLTYGYHRAEIIGVVISIFLIWGLTAALVAEGIHRLKYPEDVDGRVMFGISVAGLIVNIAMMCILHQGGGGHSGHGHSHGVDISHSHSHSHSGNQNINVRAAFIHVVGDLLQSIGVMIAAILIWVNPDYKVADPICTFLFSVLVMFTTVHLMRDAIRILMEGGPRSIRSEDVIETLMTLDNVIDVHDVHIWSVSAGKHLLSLHVQSDHETTYELLQNIQNVLKDKFGVLHSTVQIESHSQRISSERSGKHFELSAESGSHLSDNRGEILKINGAAENNMIVQEADMSYRSSDSFDQISGDNDGIKMESL